MAESRSTPQVSYRHNVLDGRHEIGVKFGKLFVPFAALEDAAYDQVSERETNRNASETDDEGEGE